MEKVLRAKKGEPDYKPFNWWMIWGMGLILVGVMVVCFLLAIPISSALDNSETTRAQKINECATVFNELSEEQREKLSYCLDVPLDENGFIVPASVEAAEDMAEFTIVEAGQLFLDCGWWMLLCVFWFGTVAAYLVYYNQEEYGEDGKTYIRKAQRNGKDISYFLADIPDGKSKIPFIILVVVPFWPVFLISWLRLNHFKKKNQMQKAGS